LHERRNAAACPEHGARRRLDPAEESRMQFGVFYELQLPKPWTADAEERLLHEALEQVKLADRIGIDYAWCVEHHFLDEYSHCSAPEVFLAAAAALTRHIRLAHGIRQVIPNYNHPARTAECVATLDLISRGRVELGIGEGATRMELGGFHVPAKEKREMSLSTAEQIANMMTMSPYPGFEGPYFSMPCRNVIPKPHQKPHPPMWIACTNRETIKVAARNGLGALCFAFVDREDAQGWARTYYDIIRSEECVPLGHSVNANIAMVTGFSLHHDRDEAVRRGQEGFEFFGFALNALVSRETVPGRTRLWEEFQRLRASRSDEMAIGKAFGDDHRSGIGTPVDMIRHLETFVDSGVDQMILMQQCGRNRHEHICESLELFGKEVLPAFQEGESLRQARKREELEPYVNAALARKEKMRPLPEESIPVIEASAARAQVDAFDVPKA
jgi:alkanesulfonate monooxygenase SsuD/methylene tetrahydromethanopterin reductase-like flavin-dependent oxidoreductase (luciferase family)